MFFQKIKQVFIFGTITTIMTDIYFQLRGSISFVNCYANRQRMTFFIQTYVYKSLLMHYIN